MPLDRDIMRERMARDAMEAEAEFLPKQPIGFEPGNAPDKTIWALVVRPITYPDPEADSPLGQNYYVVRIGAAPDDYDNSKA